MLRKLLALSMAFALVFLTIGCGDDDEDDDDEVVLADMITFETTVSVPGDVTDSTTADDWT
jgi:hypothetical protein